MGVRRRLRALEETSRERAAAAVRGAWMEMTDEEIALVLGPHHHGREPTPDERAAQDRVGVRVPEDLIARAIGYRERMAPEEVRRRMGALIGPALEGRRGRIGRRLDAMGSTS